MRLELFQQVHGPGVVGSRASLTVELLNRLYIVVKDVWRMGSQNRQRTLFASLTAKVRRQNLDADSRVGGPHCLDAIDKMLSTAIAQKKVTYDLARLMEPKAEPLKCSEFAQAIIDNF